MNKLLYEMSMSNITHQPEIIKILMRIPCDAFKK